MAKTKIDWCDFSLNPVKGLCPVGCSYCYARRMYKRFKWDETIRLDTVGVEKTLDKTKPGDKLFWGSTIDLFHPMIKQEWREWIFEVCNIYSQCIHIFLTKCPQNLPRQWPDN